MSGDEHRASPVLGVLLVVAVGLLCFSWALGSVPLSGTEGHRALPGHEMAVTGDWVVPRLFGEPYLRKPPLEYWVIGLTERLTGVANEWIWRLPSAVSAALLAGLITAMAARWFGQRAGVGAGFAYLSLACLWSQNRSADIDALLHLANAIAVFSLIEINFGPGRRRLAWGIAAGLGVGASLLLKGQSGLVVILPALVGPAIANRDWRWLKRPANWLALVLGFALFGAWVFAVVRRMGGDTLAAYVGDIRNDAADSMFMTSAGEIAKAVSLPLVLLAAALPVSLSLAYCAQRAFRASLPDSQQKLARALQGTVYAALVLLVVSGVTNARYGYQVLPPLAPCAGLVLAGWSSGVFPERWRKVFSGILASLAMLGMLAVLGVLAVGFVRFGFGWAFLGWALAGVWGGTAVLAALWSHRLRAASIGGILLLAAAAIGFGLVKNEERRERSGFEAAQVLKATIGPGTPVLAAKMVRTHPEMLYYADARVQPGFRFGTDLEPPLEWPEDVWVVFQATEWQVCSAAMPGRLSDATPLPTHVPGTVVARLRAGP